MTKAKITCPECGAAVITSYPEAVIWERCPGCKRHVWDQYDTLMADVYAPEQDRVVAFGRDA